MNLRAVALIATLALVANGCLGGSLACTDAGKTALLIPASRLASVSALRADGNCSIAPAPANCATATRCLTWKGQLVAEVVVSGTGWGSCTVSVDFNDGCASEAHDFEFNGPYDNCCEAICAKRLPAVVVASSCSG